MVVGNGPELEAVTVTVVPGMLLLFDGVTGDPSVLLLLTPVEYPPVRD